MRLESSQVDAFARIVGANHVVTDDDHLSGYETSTYLTDNTVAAIVRPGGIDEVCECVALANKLGVTVYPISTGLNTGYGSKVPSSSGALILELKRLDEISFFNENLAMVDVQPGVSQQQLFDFLEEQESDLWFDVTGSYPEHSLIGNLVERGFGHTHYADHYQHIGGMKVVLPDGDLIETGFGQFPNAKAKGAYRWGVGPHVDGLFTQGNFGIVVSATIWLIPKPQRIQNFAFSVAREDQLREVIDLLRPLRLDGTIQCGMHIGNDYKVLSSIQGFPWDEAGDETPLSQQYLDQCASEWSFGAWNVSGALYGSRAEVGAARRKIRKQFRGRVKQIRFFDEGTLKLGEKAAILLDKMGRPQLGEMLKLIKPVFGMTRGIPSGDVIKSTYWRKRGAQSGLLHPEGDRCGLLWIAPVFPTEGSHADVVWRIVKTVMLEAGFEPSVSITTISARACDCVVSIAYDREVPGEDGRALNCYQALSAALAEEGYYSYRLPVSQMQVLEQRSETYQRFLRNIKAAVDPGKVLAPKRYVP